MAFLRAYTEQQIEKGPISTTTSISKHNRVSRQLPQTVSDLALRHVHITAYQHQAMLTIVLTLARRSTQSAEESIATVTIPYSAGLSEKIRRICRGFHIHTAFRSSTTLRGLLTRAKDALPEMKRSGVIYEVPCVCGDVYVGETNRSLEVRLKEHRAAERGELEKSALAELAWEAGHVIEWEAAQVVGMMRNTAHQKFMEALRIKQRLSQCTINRDANRDASVQLSEQWLASLGVGRQ